MVAQVHSSSAHFLDSRDTCRGAGHRDGLRSSPTRCPQSATRRSITARVKAWRRAWKIALIEENNPFWEDRAIELGFDPLPAHPSTKTHNPSPGNP